MLQELWTYERRKRQDVHGIRWHFVSHDVIDPSVAYDDRPYELFFRNDDRTKFGVLRFGRRKDNPYRNYEVLVNKIMNDQSFRAALLDPTTESVWRRGWK